MADEIFDGVGEFGEGLVVAIGDEECVVAEAARAARRKSYLSFTDAFGQVEYFAGRSSDCDDGDEAGAAVRISGFGEFRQKQSATIGVGGMSAGVARGEHARCA